MIVTTLFGAIVLYAAAARQHVARGIALEPWRPIAFVAAIAIAASVLLGPIDTLADGSLAWHMVQHLAIAFFVAPLLLLGAPIRVALGALPTPVARSVARALHSTVAAVVAHPAVALATFVAVLYVAHFSPLYEAALEHPAIHAFEHALFLGSALLFWTPLLAIAPAPHAPSHAARLLVLFLALPMSAFLGFILYVTRAPLYAHYAGRPHAMADQANAGAVMWICGGAPILFAILWCVADWGARERRLGAIADRLEIIS